jgi:hypothetical protein
MKATLTLALIVPIALIIGASGCVSMRPSPVITANFVKAENALNVAVTETDIQIVGGLLKAATVGRLHKANDQAYAVMSANRASVLLWGVTSADFLTANSALDATMTKFNADAAAHGG